MSELPLSLSLTELFMLITAISTLVSAVVLVVDRLTDKPNLQVKQVELDRSFATPEKQSDGSYAVHVQVLVVNNGRRAVYGCRARLRTDKGEWLLLYREKQLVVVTHARETELPYEDFDLQPKGQKWLSPKDRRISVGSLKSSLEVVIDAGKLQNSASFPVSKLLG